MNSKTIVLIAGARPNFMKVAPLLQELQSRPMWRPELIHTGQHFSPEMSDAFFHDLGIRAPDVHLGIHSGSHAQQTAEMIRQLEPVFTARQPDMLLVVGDVNSTLAAALVASKMGIPISHVEAGLRSFDRTMPEEINRIVTDSISDLLFTSEPSGAANLFAEGHSAHKVFFCGNVMIDTLMRFRDRASQSDVLQKLGVQGRDYAVVTLHRPANVDNPARLRAIIEALDDLERCLPIVFPVHPRTRLAIERHCQPKNMMLTGPLGYLDFLHLMSNARVVLTDSGGIQEETTVLGIPCLTLRDNTERPITVEQGTNRIIGTNAAAIPAAVEEALGSGWPTPRIPPLWDGAASKRIVDVLEQQLEVPYTDLPFQPAEHARSAVNSL
jgi:UDP-N-acetylglucosamine 2-epimerase (non-hydrolysing)